MKIFLSLLILLAWATSLPAQVTQEQADGIVLERTSQETRNYTLYAKEGVQPKITVTTSTGEVFELDYPCWVYYVKYHIDCPAGMDCLMLNTGCYLIVNENNGNLLEVKAKGDTGPSDLITWIEKYKTESKEFELGSLQNILSDYVVTAIAFDSKENAWIGTQGKGLIRYNTRETVVYNSENSALPKEFWIWDIAVDKNDNVWIGTSDGAWKYDGNEFTLYNSQNTAMPEDIVWSIAVDSKNNIWMASCRFRQGGLVKYDGTTWAAYTPDNSPLPANSIHGIAIDKSDNVWLALGDYVNQVYLVEISNNKWNLYGEKELGFKPYYLGGIQCDSKNRLWGTIDYSFSSTWISPSPHFYIFDGKNATQLSCGENMRVGGSRTGITIDKDNYVWCFGVGSVSGVWFGEKWIQLDKSEFGGSSVRVIKEDPDHRIWFGTENGIYIRLNDKEENVTPFSAAQMTNSVNQLYY